MTKTCSEALEEAGQVMRELARYLKVVQSRSAERECRELLAIADDISMLADRIHPERRIAAAVCAEEASPTLH